MSLKEPKNESEKKREKSIKRLLRTPHDQIFKNSMENPMVAREFVETYVPSEIQELIDLGTIKSEKESFIDKNLRAKFSDVLLSVKTKNNENGYIYFLLETQSKPDHYMALRLFRYMISICERILKQDKKQKKSGQEKGKLPLIWPLVFYNGQEEYSSPKNFWQLFDQPEMMKNIWADKEYKLIDLKKIPDEELKQKLWSGTLGFFMKHIYDRNMLEVWKALQGAIVF